MSTTTTYYALIKPTIGGDADLWGGYLNANFDIIDALFGPTSTGIVSRANRLINPSGAINQRAAASNTDDTYCVDRWYVLTQSNAIAVSVLTNPEDGAPTGIRLTQSNASAQRMGLAQIIESINCRDLRSVITTLAGRVRLSSSANVRYAVLEWTGTADSVTSDVVNDWTSGTYTAGNFFNATTLNVLAVGSVVCTATAIRDLTALNATCGASLNNIIVFVWTEATVAQNVTLDLWRVKFEKGAVATLEQADSAAKMFADCQRYRRSVRVSMAAGVATSGNYAHSLNWADMRSAPTATSINVISNSNIASSSVDQLSAFGGRALIVPNASPHSYVADWSLDSEL
jgi:hypothetical protein